MKPVKNMTAAEVQREWNRLCHTNLPPLPEEHPLLEEMRELLDSARPWLIRDQALKRRLPPWAGLRFFARYGKRRVIVLRRWPHHSHVVWALFWRKGRFKIERWTGIQPPLLEKPT